MKKNNLKTLKDFESKKDIIVWANELRKEAIKWYNEDDFRLEDGWACWEIFFNLKAEDLE